MKNRKHKYQKKRINGVDVAVENKKWASPMKPRIPKTRTHADPLHPSRQDLKSKLSKEIEDSERS